jgi:hypothetical protein
VGDVSDGDLALVRERMQRRVRASRWSVVLHKNGGNLRAEPPPEQSLGNLYFLRTLKHNNIDVEIADLVRSHRV